MSNTAAKLAAVAIYGATIATIPPGPQAIATAIAATTIQIGQKRNSNEG